MGFRVKTEDESLGVRILRDNRVSLKAKGLFFTVLIKSESYFTIDGLSKNLLEGRDSIRSAAHELETFGYIERIKDNPILGGIK